MKSASLLAVLLIATSTAMAQSQPLTQSHPQHERHDHHHAGAIEDATVTLPEAYKLQFENDWVKVTRVHYAPHVKLPAHAHTSWASAYVYLNSSGPVVFRHVGGTNGTITRAPTFRGGFRLYRAVPGELHEVDNTSATPSDFLRIEMKTDPVAPQTLRGKFLPEPTFDEPLQVVQFENGQVRITRLYWPRGRVIEIAPGDHPSLIVSLSEHNIGAVTWINASEGTRLENTSLPAMEALRFELKTAPHASAALAK
jgi:hypothetical protein